jgi:UDP-3-O-[3-hydroxymyristoyl] glucosamine N-acyltransferase
MRIPKEFSFTDIFPTLSKFEYLIKGEPQSFRFKGIKSLNSSSKYLLDWCSAKDMDAVTEYVSASQADVLILNIGNFEKIEHPFKSFIFVANPKFFISELLFDLFFTIKQTASDFSQHFLLGNPTFGENVQVGAHSIFGQATIGDNSFLSGNNFIYDNVILGKNVFLGPGAVIGKAGFGYIEGFGQEFKQFTHAGGVVIGDYVEIGANSVIDRGSLDDTTIGPNTKIDSLVHIGHNVSIGRNCMICSNTTISGSVSIGDNVWISPNSVLLDHISVADNTFIGLGSVVVNSILRPKKVFGNPAKELKF